MSGVKRMVKAICALVFGFGLFVPGVARADELYSVWRLVPTQPVGAVEVPVGEPFLTQRLLPYEAVRLLEPAQIKRRRQIDAGTVLFKVFQADGQAAYCTLKDQSAGNAAGSLFIPILDRRPCLVDHDKDGIFDSRFSVYDGYGSALTPSGNLSNARDLRGGGAYEVVDPSEFPLFRGFRFYLLGAEDIENRSIGIDYDNGGGYDGWQNVSPGSTPERPTALNIAVTEIVVGEELTTMTIDVDDSVYLIGNDEGRFVVGGVPLFVDAGS